MRIPTSTRMDTIGTRVSFLRSTNKALMHATVISRVSRLNYLKVSTIIFQGLVRAFEPAATKKALRF